MLTAPHPRHVGADAPEQVTIAIEVDGLLQRFGRLVPDTAALIHRLGELRRTDGSPALQILLFRIGRDEAALRDDLEWLGIPAGYRAPKQTVAADARDLATKSGSRTIFFVGREQTAREMLALGLPTYVVSDRLTSDHRLLPIVEADRVAAESIRVPVPRPMSEQTRRGMLFSIDASSPHETRARGIDALRLDSRADWLTLGENQILYVELPMAADWLRSAGALQIAADVPLGAISILPAEGAQPDITPLARTPRHVLHLRQDGTPGNWRHERRTRIDAPAPPNSGTDFLPSLRGHRYGAGAGSSMPGLGQLDPVPPAAVSQERGLDGDTLSSRMLPFLHPQIEALSVIWFDSGAEPHLSEFAAELARQAGLNEAVLIFKRQGSASESLQRLLWQQEENNLAAAVHLTAVGSPPEANFSGRVPVLEIQVDWNRENEIAGAAQRLRQALETMVR